MIDYEVGWVEREGRIKDDSCIRACTNEEREEGTMYSVSRPGKRSQLGKVNINSVLVHMAMKLDRMMGIGNR